MAAARSGPHGEPRRLSVDWTACDGRGLCLDLLPELLEPDPWGFPRPRSGSAKAGGPGGLTAVPDELAGPARRAVHLCPKLALRLSR
jgi:ferredoxin